MAEKTLNRRQFIEVGCKLGAGALLASVTGCSGDQVISTPNEDFLKIPPAKENGKVVLGIYQSRDMRKICEETVAAVSDMKWLSRGDSVFVKIACNSPNRHPSVTSPEAIEAMVGFLKDRGAGTVYVGDQSGIEFVRLTRTGRTGSTQDLMTRCGQLEGAKSAGAKIYCFDDHGWDNYHKAESDFENVWEDNLYLPDVLREVDHIVYLPRLGTHSIAGYTCGIKNAVGWLRDDSRLFLHQGGPVFFKRIAEINHFPLIRKKLRLTATLGDSALVHMGPDFGTRYQFGGCFGLASTRLLDHDYLASSMIPWLSKHAMSIYDLYSPYPTHVNYWNREVVKGAWGEEGLRNCRTVTPYRFGTKIENDPCLSHLATIERYRPRKIVLIKKGDNIPDGLVVHLKESGEGILAI